MSWRRFVLVTLLGLSLILVWKQDLTAQVPPHQLVQQAQQQYERGQSTQALRLLQQAGNIYQAQKQVISQAQVLALTSLVQQQQQNWTAARTSIKQTLNLIESVRASQSKVRVEAQIEHTQGHYWFATGQYSQALASWQQAENLYLQLKDDVGISGMLLSQAEALDKLGFHRRACDRALTILDSNFQECKDLQPQSVKLILAQTQLNKSLFVDSLLSMSNSLLSMGKLSLAQQLIQACQDRGDLSRLSPLTQVKTVLSLGNVNRALALRAKETDDLANFRSHSQRAIECFQKLHKRTNLPVNRTYKLAAKLNELSLYATSKQWSKAQALVKKIRLLDSDLPSAQIKFANSLVLLQRQNLTLNYLPEDIAAIYQRVISQAHQSGDRRLESYAWGHLGEYQNQLQHEGSSQKSFERALLLAQAIQAPEIAYRWQWQLGRIYHQQELREEAIASYQAALTNLDSLRSDLAALEKEVQYEFKEQIEPVYRELADLLLTGSPDDTDLELARNVIEALQVAELDNYFQDACLTYEAKAIDRLDRSAAIIYTIILPNRLEVIVAMADQTTSHLNFYHHQSPVTQTKLETTVEQLRSYITEPDRTKEVQQLSAQIYGWLMRPLTANLTAQQPKTLVFVLDGILQTIPMAALYDGKQYLLERYAIALTPGLRLLNPQTDAPPLSFLAAGISQSQIIEERHFAPLNSVPAELKTAGGQNPILLNRQFTPKRLLEQLNKTSASVVHLATHGQFSSNPRKTFLLMWQKLLTVEEFSKIMQNRFKIDANPVRLLVLSACNTATGDRRAALGMAGIAVRSGAFSTMATLWQVDDNSTTILMKRFYQYLNHGSKAEALRKAQLELWQTAGKDWQVPAFWSAYVIIGNWQ